MLLCSVGHASTGGEPACAGQITAMCWEAKPSQLRFQTFEEILGTSAMASRKEDNKVSLHWLGANVTEPPAYPGRILVDVNFLEGGGSGITLDEDLMSGRDSRDAPPGQVTTQK
ncbi:unnamed protein product [Symbiodinium sp. KB8]|nr:unnamed protein product [Symbiodinium sp. KB8]